MKSKQVGQAMSYAAKKTALALHGLAPSDRKWLLDQLTNFQRSDVERAEAVLVRMVRDKPLNFDELIAPTVNGEPNLEWGHEAKKTLDTFPYGVVKLTLDALPVSWIAGILEQSAWKEAARYVGELKASDREFFRAESDFRPNVSRTLTLALVSELTRGNDYG